MSTGLDQPARGRQLRPACAAVRGRPWELSPLGGATQAPQVTELQAGEISGEISFRFTSF